MLHTSIRCLLLVLTFILSFVTSYIPFDIFNSQSVPEAQADITAGLIAQYTFDNNTNDSTGSNHGTFIGGTANYQIGKLGQALNFDGDDDYVEVNDSGTSPLDITGTLTIGAWIYPQTTAKGIIVGKKTDSAASGYYVRTFANDLEFAWSDGVTTHIYTFTSDNPIITQVWQHVAVSYDLQNVRFYINGILHATVPHTESIAVNNQSLRIGNYRGNPPTAYHFNGMIDDVRIYNRALSAADVAELHSLGVQSNDHPIYNPTGNVSTLQTSVASYMSMTDTELRAQVDTAGRNNGQNIIMVGKVKDLALLYHLTGTTDYARRAAVLLDRYADVFPSWPKDYGNANGDGIWTNWFHGDLKTAQPLAEVYDLIYNSGMFIDRIKIKNFLKDVVKEDFKFRLYVFNTAQLRGQAIVAFGRILEDPELTHLGFWFYDKMIHWYYGYDGFMTEGTYSYHYQTTPAFLKNMEYLDGYSDPPGYVHVPFEAEYDSPFITNFQSTPKYSEHWARMNSSLFETSLPNTEFPILNDTHYFPGGKSGRKGEVPGESILLGGLGHAALTYGSGSAQTQARLDFSHTAGHRHQDANHLIFWDKGKEVLGGTGYIAGNRNWNTTVHNQNLVVVNAKEQKSGNFIYYTDSPYVPDLGRRPVRTAAYVEESPNANHHNNLLLWEPGYQGDKEVQVVEVDATNAYRDDINRYRRMLALVHMGNNDTYLVDFFRLRGGTSYDWLAHGGHTTNLQLANGQTAYSLSTNLSLTPVTGSIGADPNGSYPGITNLQTANTDQSWQAVLDHQGVKERILMAGDPETTVYTGKGLIAPEVGTNTVAYQDYLVVRRSARSTEDENYLALHEVYTAQPRISTITKLNFEGDPGTAVGLAVNQSDGTIDYLIHTLDEQAPYPEHRVQGINNFSIRGRFGHVRVKNGQVQWMKLLQGSELNYNDKSVKANGGDFSYRGTITQVDRKEKGNSSNTFHANISFPSGSALNGKALIVKWGNGWTWGYTIESVNGNKITVKEEPGFDLVSGIVKNRYFPVGDFPGPVSFTVSGSAYVNAANVLTATAPGTITSNPQVPTGVFVLSDKIQVNTATLDVRSCASTSCSILGMQADRALGAIISTSPTTADGFTWHNINYATGVDGWSVESSLVFAGDLNRDANINSLDWGMMNSAWFTNSATADINSDGMVNSIDFSLLNANWGKSI